MQPLNSSVLIPLLWSASMSAIPGLSLHSIGREGGNKFNKQESGARIQLPPMSPRHHFISYLLPLICPGSRLSLISVFQVLSDFLRDGHFSLPSGLWEVGKTSNQGVRDKKGIRIDESSKEEITPSSGSKCSNFQQGEVQICFQGEHKPLANF